MKTQGLISCVSGLVAFWFVIIALLNHPNTLFHFIAGTLSLFACFNYIFDGLRGWAPGFLLAGVWAITTIFQFIMAMPQ